MISFFRKHRKGVVGAFIVSVCAVLMLPFGADYFGAPKMVRYVAKVGEVEIPTNVFFRETQRVESMFRQQFGEQYETFASMINIKQRVLDDLVDREVLAQSFDKMGLRVGLNQIEQYASTLPMFADGVDRSSFEMFLKAQGLSEKEFESKVREQIIEDQLTSILELSGVLTDQELEKRYQASQVKLGVSYVEVVSPESSISKPTEEEMRAYYDSNSSLFFSSREVMPLLLRFPVSSYESQVVVHKEDLEDAYKNRLSEFKIPASARLQILSFPKSNKGVEGLFGEVEADDLDKKEEESEEALKVLAQSVREEVVTNTESFKDIGRSKGALYQEDDKLRSLDGLDAVVRSKVNILKEGQVSEVIDSSDSYQIIKILELIPSRVRPIKEVSQDLEREVRQAIAPEFAMIAAEELMSKVLQKTGDERESEIRRLIADTGIEKIEPEASFSSSSSSAYLPEKEISEVISSGKNVVKLFQDKATPVLVFIKDVKEPALKSFDDVKEGISQVLIEKAKSEGSTRLANDLIDKIKSKSQSERFNELKNLAEINDLKLVNLEPSTAELVKLPFVFNPQEKSDIFAQLSAEKLIGEPYSGGDGKIYLIGMSGMESSSIVPDSTEWLAFSKKERESAKERTRSILLTRLKMSTSVEVRPEVLNP